MNPSTHNLNIIQQKHNVIINRITKDYEVYPKYGNDPNDPANIPYMAPYVEDD